MQQAGSVSPQARYSRQPCNSEGGEEDVVPGWCRSAYRLPPRVRGMRAEPPEPVGQLHVHRGGKWGLGGLRHPLVMQLLPSAIMHIAHRNRCFHSAAQRSPPLKGEAALLRCADLAQQDPDVADPEPTHIPGLQTNVCSYRPNRQLSLRKGPLSKDRGRGVPFDPPLPTWRALTSVLWPG